MNIGSTASTYTQLSQTFASTTTKGNLLLLFEVVNGGSAITMNTPTDTGTNAWQRLLLFANTATTQTMAVWGCVNNAATASHQVTGSWGTATNGDIAIAEFSGLFGPLAVDGTPVTVTTATALANVVTPTFTPATFGDLLLSLCAPGQAMATSGAFGAPWSQIAIDTSATGIGWGYFADVGITPEHANWTQSAAAAYGSAIVGLASGLIVARAPQRMPMAV